MNMEDRRVKSVVRIVTESKPTRCHPYKPSSERSARRKDKIKVTVLPEGSEIAKLHTVVTEDRKTARAIEQEIPFFDGNVVDQVRHHKQTINDVWDTVDNKELVDDEVIKKLQEGHRLMMASIKERNSAIREREMCANSSYQARVQIRELQSKTKSAKN